ncbi:MAG: hypothetical protein V4489_10315 [Chlamydiota bacterium]
MLSRISRAELPLVYGLVRKSLSEASWRGRSLTTLTKDCPNPRCVNFKDKICCIHRDEDTDEMSPWNPAHEFVHPLHQYTHPTHPANVFRSIVDSAGDIVYEAHKDNHVASLNKNRNLDVDKSSTESSLDGSFDEYESGSSGGDGDD